MTLPDLKEKLLQHKSEIPDWVFTDIEKVIKDTITSLDCQIATLEALIGMEEDDNDWN